QPAQVNINQHSLHFRNHVHILDMPGLEIQGRIDPGSTGMAVVDDEHLSAGVARGLGIKEERIPMISGPHLLPQRAKKRSDPVIGSTHAEMEAVFYVHHWTRSGEWLQIEQQDGTQDADDAEEQPEVANVHRRLSFNW